MDFLIQRISSHDGELIQKIGETLCFLKKDYPDFLCWYAKKVISGLSTSQRQIYVARSVDDSKKILGVMILKDTLDEKKICSLFVSEGHRQQGIGTRFLTTAESALNVCKPLITVSSERKTEFEPLFKKFGYVEYDCYPEYYRTGINEISYNGPIESFALKEIVNA